MAYSNERRPLLPACRRPDRGTRRRQRAGRRRDGGRHPRADGRELGVGITGIAGPGGGTPEKPVGTVVIALERHPADTARPHVRILRRPPQVKFQATQTALDMVRRACSARRNELPSEGVRTCDSSSALSWTTAVRESSAAIADSSKRQLGRRSTRAGSRRQPPHHALVHRRRCRASAAPSDRRAVDRPFVTERSTSTSPASVRFHASGAPRVFWLGVQEGAEAWRAYMRSCRCVWSRWASHRSGGHIRRT